MKRIIKKFQNLIKNRKPVPQGHKPPFGINSLSTKRLEELRHRLRTAEQVVLDAEKTSLEHPRNQIHTRLVVPHLITAWNTLDELKWQIQKELNMPTHSDFLRELDKIRGENKPTLTERHESLLYSHYSKPIDEFIERVLRTNNVSTKDIQKVIRSVVALYELKPEWGVKYLKRLRKLDLPWGYHKTFERDILSRPYSIDEEN